MPPKRKAADVFASGLPTPPSSPAKRPKPSSPPGIQARRRSWAAQLIPWDAALHPGYKHLKGTVTMCKTMAMKEYHITKEDIESLPHTLRRNPAPRAVVPMYRYSMPQLDALAKRKAAHLGVESLDPKKQRQQADARGQAAVSTVVAPSETQREAFVAASNGSWMRECIEASKDPSIRKVHTYVQPAGARRPDPPGIAWETGAMGPFRMRDACLLYCLEPKDLADLAEGAQWLDRKSVAMRALTLHGGFYAHAELVLERVRSEIASLESSGQPLSPSFSLLSPSLRAQLQLDPDSDWPPPPDSEDDHWRKPPVEWGLNRVMQWRPPKVYRYWTSDWSADELWYPFMTMALLDIDDETLAHTYY